jgi:hypothetical protein
MRHTASVSTIEASTRELPRGRETDDQQKGSTDTIAEYRFAISTLRKQIEQAKRKAWRTAIMTIEDRNIIEMMRQRRAAVEEDLYAAHMDVK